MGPLAKNLKVLPRKWRFQDDRAFRKLRRYELKSTIPLERRFASIPIDRREKEIEGFFRNVLSRSGFDTKKLRRLLRTNTFKQLPALGAPFFRVDTGGAF